jgi:hypothetical protein
MIKKIFSIVLMYALPIMVMAQAYSISNDSIHKKVTFRNNKISAIITYDHSANISSLFVDGHQVTNSDKGIFSEIKTTLKQYSTLQLARSPKITIIRNNITMSEIVYGDDSVVIAERWTLTIGAEDFTLKINRNLSKQLEAESVSSPVIQFNNINTWDGAFLDYGGLAWFYLFDKVNDTYGVHSRSSRFWNKKTGVGLNVDIGSKEAVAMSFSHTPDHQLRFGITVSDSDIIPRMDSGTHRRRFLRDTLTEVWSPVRYKRAPKEEEIRFSYFDFNRVYNRGTLKGINQHQVSDVLNTIARIGVIDKEHFGGNSWHTPYGPICLHEQYIGQLGVAINDPSYLKGYQDCLDFYRDNAIKEDGRVWARWAYTNEDAMPGAYTNKGFYEAQWGYLMDANPDFVINVSELYDQIGDKVWVRSHVQSCEKVLDWILRRDRNGNGLVEMMTDSTEQQRGSDWIDIIWASYENAFVNAKLYYALSLWADIELQLGNASRGRYYIKAAEKLKTSFNAPVSGGGFWDGANGCYIHWRDKGGSLHGRNMVTPVNFMAIAYGICDDESRAKTILDRIETQMVRENLFFWPLCMNSYAKGEGKDWQFPFPNYENGDIFLSWGAVAVKAYASYNPAIALKYIKNVLGKFEKDGLAFQRYGRKTQDGLGDDILSGNALSVVGLYKSIYGINPRYNRLYIDPHIIESLSGTVVRYNFRGQVISIALSTNNYSVSNDRFSITDSADFGFASKGNILSYFHAASDSSNLEAETSGGNKLSLQISNWKDAKYSWTASSKDDKVIDVNVKLKQLKPNTEYVINKGKEKTSQARSNARGELIFQIQVKKEETQYGVCRK